MATKETKLARTVPAAGEPDWRVCDSGEMCSGPVRWRVRVLDRSGQQVLYSLYACHAHRGRVEAQARRRDD